MDESQMTTTDLCNHAKFGEIEGVLAKAKSRFQVSDRFRTLCTQET